MSTIEHSFKNLNSKVWKTQVDGFQYPELVDGGFGSICHKPNTGICFSGGGTRSASATHGQLRALDNLGLLEGIRYMSSVSGGAWGAVPYAYLPDNHEDDHFFGSIIQPEKITKRDLVKINKSNYLYAVTHSSVIGRAIKYWAKLAGDETFSRIIGDIFLKPFGIDSRKRFFAYTQDHVQSILERNLSLKKNNFQTVKKDRPFLIVGGTLLRPGRRDVLFEMTPWYSGVSELYENYGSQNQNIGGGYIESFAFDSDAPDTNSIDDGYPSVRIGNRRHMFTLSDVIGTSGAAPAEVLKNAGVEHIGFPAFKYWPVAYADNKSLKAKEYEFGDGGNLENLGIIPLLKRGVERIVVFVNSKKKLNGNNLRAIDGAIAALFTPNHVNNIFDENGLSVLSKELNERRGDGDAAICLREYSLIDNEHHGLNAGQRVKILWVYNERFLNWENRLPDAIKLKIGSGKLAHYPHYATFSENSKIIDLKSIQASLLSQLASAVILENETVFREMLE